MYLALVAGALQTKYLTMIFDINRGAYDNLPLLVVTAMIIATFVPLIAIAIWGRRVR
jgi:hypothetical protein